ncbi:MAG TPA: hypothetical protein VF488_09680, partial [Gemmatimonadaceae bacterium]
MRGTGTWWGRSFRRGELRLECARLVAERGEPLHEPVLQIGVAAEPEVDTRALDRAPHPVAMALIPQA